MFVIDQNITDLNIREKNILKLLFSMNIHQVATPEMILEEARSYILFFRETGGKVSAYIALHLTVTNRQLYYVHSSNPFPEKEMEAVEQEALEFAEGLGAVLDEKDLAKMTVEEKKAWIDAQEIFAPKKAAPEPPVQPAPSLPAEAAPAQQTPPPAVPVQQAPQAAAASAPPAAQATPAQQELPVQPAPPAQPMSMPQPPEVAVPATAPHTPEPTVQKNQPQQASATSKSAVPSAEAAKKRQEILQKAVKEGIAKPPKQSSSPPPAPPTGVVSRDREALARLLTSF